MLSSQVVHFFGQVYRFAMIRSCVAVIVVGPRQKITSRHYHRRADPMNSRHKPQCTPRWTTGPPSVFFCCASLPPLPDVILTQALQHGQRCQNANEAAAHRASPSTPGPTSTPIQSKAVVNNRPPTSWHTKTAASDGDAIWVSGRRMNCRAASTSTGIWRRKGNLASSMIGRSVVFGSGDTRGLR